MAVGDSFPTPHTPNSHPLLKAVTSPVTQPMTSRETREAFREDSQLPTLLDGNQRAGVSSSSSATYQLCGLRQVT